MTSITFIKKICISFTIFIALNNAVLAQDITAIITNILPTDTAVANVIDTVAKKTGNEKILYGIASFYSPNFEGRKTANGEIFKHAKYTAACNVLPLGTWIEITNLRNNKKIIAKTNDRMHPRMKRLVDLTYAAAKKLDFVAAGLTKVKVVVLGKHYKKVDK